MSPLESKEQAAVRAALASLAEQPPIDDALFAEVIALTTSNEADFHGAPPADESDPGAPDTWSTTVAMEADQALRELRIQGTTRAAALLAEAMRACDYPSWARWEPERLVTDTPWEDEDAALDLLIPAAYEGGHTRFSKPAALSEAGIRRIVAYGLDLPKPERSLEHLPHHAGFDTAFLERCAELARSGVRLDERLPFFLYGALAKTILHHRDLSIDVWRALDEAGDPKAVYMLAFFGIEGAADRMREAISAGQPGPQLPLMRAFRAGLREAPDFPLLAWAEAGSLLPGAIQMAHLADRPVLHEHLWGFVVAGLLGEDAEQATRACRLLIEHDPSRADAAKDALQQIERLSEPR